MRQRTVTFSTLFNFRDLGGYRGVDGRTVRWRRLFRADDLSRLGDEDRAGFATLAIRTVVDLRRPNEIDEFGRIPAFDGFTYRHVHLRHPRWPRVEFADNGERLAYLRARYLEMAENAADGFGEALRLVADAETAPLVFHCIAGKDRTGLVAALVLALLGVADPDIAADYELSEASEERYWAWRVRVDPAAARRRMRHITVSPRQGMLTFLTDLRARHGSIERYLAGVGVTAAHIASMRAHLLTHDCS